MTNSVREVSVGAPGRGIIGMRERVESLGGTMATSVLDDTFELAITLPVDVGADLRDVQVIV